MEDNLQVFTVVSPGRADDIVAQAFGVSKNSARRLLETRQVFSREQSLRAGLYLDPGEVLFFQKAKRRLYRDDENPCALIYQDEQIIAVAKPPAMHSVRHSEDEELCVSDALRLHDSEIAGASPDDRESGLLQRLDFHTSGVMVAARNRESWTVMREIFQGENIRKEYIALVDGHLREDELVVDAPLRLKRNDNKVTVCCDDDDFCAGSGERVFSARSIITCLLRSTISGQNSSLVRVTGTSLRRHQVRAHLSSIGHTLIGDTLYGSTRSLTECAGSFLKRAGFLLHAAEVSFDNPFTGEHQKLEAASEEIRYIQNLLQ